MENDFAIKNIPDNWELITLGELLDKEGGAVQTGPFGSQLHASDYVEKGIPSVMPKNITIEGINQDDIARITYEDAHRLKKYLLAKGDIVYSRRGDVEKCALVKNNESGWLCGTGCLRVRLGANSKLTPEYLHAYLSAPAIREWISRNAVGATMPNLNTGILKNVPLIVPTKKATQFIADAWLTINSKITLNQKTNQTLEQMAQALFKSWFVDFDPVFDNLLASVDFNLENLENPLPDELKQKAQRRLAALNSLHNAAECKASLSALAHELQTHSPTQAAVSVAETPAKPNFNANPKILAQHANIHAQFPKEFEHNEQLGWIPKSWNNRDINSIAEITDYVANGSFASLKENVSLSDERGYALYIRTTDFKNEFSLTKAKYVSKHSYDFLKKSKLIGDEVIISNVGDVGTVFRPPIWLGMPMTVGSNAISLKSNKLNNYLYLYFSNDFGQYQIDSITSGSAQQKFNKTGFRKLSVLTPSIEVIDVFNTSYDELNYKLQKNKENTFSITSLRDALLPKLISGELQMPDVATDDEIVD